MGFLRKMGKAIAHYIRNTDRLLLLLCAAVSIYGCLLVYSDAQTSGGGRSAYLVQFLACALGYVAAVVISKIDYELLCRLWPVMAVISLGLMALTFTSLGITVPGTDDTAWLRLNLGPVKTTFQPAELLKIVFVVTFSVHLTRVYDTINRPLTVLLLCLHGMFPVGLVFLQGDYGTALVFIFIFICMLFAGGLRPLYFLVGLIGVTAAVPIVWQAIGQDKRDRILSLIFVEEYLSTTGWQQYLGVVALGSGKLWGVGYMQGGDHQVYARNNDFVFTVAGEEFGFIGALAVIILLLAIVLVIMRDAVRAKDRLGMLLCTGMMSLIGFQSLINVGMTLRLIPVIGITLPFFSSGGSSVATLYLGIGLVLSVYYSSRTRMRNTIFVKKV
ncbi:MAG: FtsW/RodA/SpoVE family cell cycle protein [Clostridiales bacterium]|nr:FtsW/RodA/SpoVE family cell cycle protein [Clostridiales bacterium]